MPGKTKSFRWISKEYPSFTTAGKEEINYLFVSETTFDSNIHKERVFPGGTKKLNPNVVLGNIRVDYSSISREISTKFRASCY